MAKLPRKTSEDALTWAKTNFGNAMITYNDQCKKIGYHEGDIFVVVGQAETWEDAIKNADDNVKEGKYIREEEGHE